MNVTEKFIDGKAHVTVVLFVCTLENGTKESDVFPVFMGDSNVAVH